MYIILIDIDISNTPTRTHSLYRHKIVIGIRNGYTHKHRQYIQKAHIMKINIGEKYKKNKYIDNTKKYIKIYT